MENERFCFGCDGEFDLDDDIASSNRLSFHDFARESSIDSNDIVAIRAFYYQSKNNTSSRFTKYHYFYGNFINAYNNFF